MESTGRSGARFWLSHDRVFVIKMIGSEDVIEMHRLLQDYHQVIDWLQCIELLNVRKNWKVLLLLAMVLVIARGGTTQ